MRTLGYERLDSIKYRTAKRTEQSLCRGCSSEEPRFTGMLFEGEYRFTKKMVANFYEVEERTIERLLEEHGDELKYNGYILSKGKQLKEFKIQFAPVINVGSKTDSAGLIQFPCCSECRYAVD